MNTGWTGGSFGVGSRIELSYTRAMIKAAITGKLNDVEYYEQPIFGLSIPKTCPDVPNAILNPRDTWRNEEEYDIVAISLAKRFMKNFDNYKDQASKAIINAGPTLELIG